MTPEETAQVVRALYGASGWTVYDRIDRWHEEHYRPIAGALHPHQEVVISGIPVTECPVTNQVLVHSQFALGRSRCGRCLDYILTAEMGDFLHNDYLCWKCTGESDPDAAQRIVQAERAGRPRTP